MNEKQQQLIEPQPKGEHTLQGQGVRPSPGLNPGAPGKGVTSPIVQQGGGYKTWMPGGIQPVSVSAPVQTDPTAPDTTLPYHPPRYTDPLAGG